VNLDEVLGDARSRLADWPREALGESPAARRILGIPRSARIVRRGSAWHLGVLLLTDDGVLATGDIIRAQRPAPRGFTAESQRHRAELRAAAFRGGFAEGETVHIGWEVLDLDAVRRGAVSGPLAVVDGIASVRWSAAAGYVPLEGYLADRIDLLRNPPGA
jgi:hypothetical protein